MSRWFHNLKAIRHDRATWLALGLYLAVVLPTLVVVESFDTPTSHPLAHGFYLIGVIIATMVLAYWLTRRTATQLQNSEARYRELVDHSADGIFVCDQQGQYLDANPAACALLGYTRAEILRRKVTDIIVPEDLAARPVQLDQLSSGQVVSTERRLRRKDGQLISVAINTRVINANRMLATVRDISAQKAAETALQASERQLRALINAMSDVILVLSADGRYRQVAPTNTAALVAPPDQLVGKTLHDVLPGNLADAGLAAIQETLQTRQTVTLDYRLPIGDRTYWFQAAISAISPEEVVWVARDMTAARQRDRERAATASLASTLRTAVTPSEILPLVLDQADHWLEVESSAIGLINSAGTDVVLHAARGIWADFIGDSLPLSHGIAAQIVRNGSPYASNELPIDPQIVRKELLRGLRAMIAVPLSAENITLGIFAVGRTEPFTADDVQLVTTLCDIAAGALQRAAAHDQAQRRADQLATLNTIGRTLAELLDLPQIYAQLAAAIVQIQPDLLALIISQFDPAKQLMTCVYGWEEGQPLEVSQFPPIPLEPTGYGVQSESIHQRQPIIVNDLPTRLKRAKTNLVIGKEPLSAIYVPLVAKGEVIGVVQVQSVAYNHFTQEDAELLSFIASTAAVAIQNARLFEAEHKQRTRAEALAQLASQLNVQIDLPTVLHLTCVEVAHALNTPASSIYLYDDAAQNLMYASDHGLPAFFGQCVRPMPRAIFDMFSNRPDRLIIVPDIQSFTELPDADLYVQCQLRTIAGAGLWREDRLIGLLNVKSLNSVRQFTDDELTLLTAFAAQAAIAIENMQLVEAERRQRELAEALRDSAAALNSTLNQEEVLDRILANVGRLVPNDAASIIVIENQIGRVVRWSGYSAPGHAEAIQDVLLPLSQVSNLRHIVETGEPAVISNTRTDPEWVDIPASRWIQSNIGVPIRTRGRILGVLAVDSMTPDFYTQEHAERLLALAGQAAIAIENAQLYEAAQRRTAEQAALLEASRAISSTLDLPTMLQRLAEQMGRAIDVTSTYICDWDASTGLATVLAEYYGPHAQPQELVSDLGHAYSLEQDLGLTTEWLANLQPLVAHVYDRTQPEPRLQHMLEYGAQSILTVPLTARGKLFGYAELWESRHHREFTTEEISLCSSMAQQAAIAFENARLFEAERKQLRLAQTLQAVGALLTAEMSLDEVFDYLFDLLARAVRYDSVSIQLIGDNQVLFAAGRGFRDVRRANEIIRNSLVPTLEERWGQPHRRVMVISDTEQDPRWLVLPGSEPIRSWIGAALRVKGHLLGILNVDSFTANTYNEATGETVAAFANQAAIAIENAQLHDAIRRHADELEERVIERTAELERERKRTAVILEAAGEGIMLTDNKGMIEYLNPAVERLTGFSSAEAIGQNPRLWQSGRTPVSQYQKMWHTITRGGIWQGELVNRRKDGSLYSAALTIAPVYDIDGQISGFVGVQRDISQQKELDRLKDEFVSNVSHELRTPIANVKLYISLLTRGKPEKYEDYLQTLRREAARLEKLIEDLLDLSRLDLGKTPVTLEPTDVGQLAAQLITDRTALAAGRNLLIDYRTGGALPFAQADPAMLGQVISNLLTNAINYTPAGGLITVTTTQQHRDNQEWITITVQDTGSGISQKDFPHLFERFYRGETGRKSGAPGTGLGLAISAQIMNKLGGLITIDTPPGEGASFTLWLKPA
jgi:PAS domain S-box-containing protein